MSALNTGTYKWANFFVPLLQHLTFNEFTLKNSFDFAKRICEQDAGLFMASLDADSLFTNVLLDETINFLMKPSIFGLMSYSKVIVVFMIFKKKQITKMLSLTTRESIILFDMAFYTQIDDEAMGSPLELSLANAFLYCHEKMVEWMSPKI